MDDQTEVFPLSNSSAKMASGWGGTQPASLAYIHHAARPVMKQLIHALGGGSEWAQLAQPP